MYSVLLLNENDKWKFLTNTDGSQYIAETLIAVQEKVKETAKVRPLNEIQVIKLCTITESITVVESGAENNTEVEQNQEEQQ